MMMWMTDSHIIFLCGSLNLILSLWILVLVPNFFFFFFDPNISKFFFLISTVSLLLLSDDMDDRKSRHISRVVA